jgi:hypothetical protein
LNYRCDLPITFGGVLIYKSGITYQVTIDHFIDIYTLLCNSGDPSEGRPRIAFKYNTHKVEAEFSALGQAHFISAIKFFMNFFI